MNRSIPADSLTEMVARRCHAFMFLMLALSVLSARAEELAPELIGPQSVSREYSEDSAVAHPSGSRGGQHLEDNAGDQQMRLRTWGIVLGNTLAVGLYGRHNWWSDGFSGSFRTVNEGWFGQNTYSGGADKLGHFYMNYAGTRLFARAFEWAGNGPGRSLELAAWLTLGTYTTVEVIDGFSKKWRFSKEDAIMNVAGVGAALLIEKNPQLDRLLDLRLLYRPSRSDNSNIDPFGDYSGQTYLLVAKASGVPVLRNHPWLRYFELAIGYGSRGYSDNPVGVDGNRSRNLYLGISLNLSEVLGATIFKRSDERDRVQRGINTVLEFVQVPGTAALVRHGIRSD